MSRSVKNKIPLQLELMSQDELYSLCESEDVVLPPSDLESECSDEGSDALDNLDLLQNNELILDDTWNTDSENEIADQLDWESEDELSLAALRTRILRDKPTWSKFEKPEPPFDFDKLNSGLPEFIKSMKNPTPFQLFQLFISDELLQLMVYQTNLYAEQDHLKTGKKFSQTNLDEMKVFLGINIHMGMKRLPSYRDHWSSEPDLHDYFIANLMSVNRFGWFLSNLHLNNNAEMPKRNEQSYDKLYKLRPFLFSLSESFRKCLNLHEHVAVDESMIRFKGRSSLKQYMPKKPIKRGFKVWILADESGYAWKFDIYTGKSSEGTQKDLGASVVKKLCEDLIGSGRKIYFDNYFNGVELLTWLKENKLNACGTVNSHRKNLPNFKPDKQFKKGDIDSYGSNTGLAAWKWKDNRCIHLASNYHDPSEITFVNRKDKQGNVSQVPCPSVLKEYNTYMNSVDKFDQIKAVYEINRKSKKWWHRVFFYFIDASITNAFIIYKLLGKKDKKMKEFRREIVHELVAAKTVNSIRKRLSYEMADTIKLGRKKPTTSSAIRHTDSAHQPVRDTRRRCANCSTAKNEVRTDWICSVCRIPLCLSKRRNCFQDYHYVSLMEIAEFNILTHIFILVLEIIFATKHSGTSYDPWPIRKNHISNEKLTFKLIS